VECNRVNYSVYEDKRCLDLIYYLFIIFSLYRYIQFEESKTNSTQRSKNKTYAVFCLLHHPRPDKRASMYSGQFDSQLKHARNTALLLRIIKLPYHNEVNGCEQICILECKQALNQT